MSVKINKWWENLRNTQQPETETESELEEREVQEINPEFEEKPIVNGNQEMSEDFHGGQELTFSIEDSLIKNQENSEDTKDTEARDTEEENKRDNEGESIDKSNETENNDNQQPINQSESQEAQQGKEEATETEESRGKEENLGEENKSSSKGEPEENLSEKEHFGERNNVAIVDLKKVTVSIRLRTAFQRFIEKIAEVETKYEEPGFEKLSVKQLLKRSIERKPLGVYRVNRLRETVILLVDTSGSMEWWADILQKMVSIALKRGDIEMFEAPNGIVTRPIKDFNQLFEWYNWEDYRNHHAEFMRKTKGRTIVFIGDYDGADTVYYLGKHNIVFWICNENRYEDTCDHDWNKHCLSEYPKSVKIYFAYDEGDLEKLKPSVFKNAIDASLPESEYRDYHE